MKQVWNPYLPLDEYIPDGEPHVFGDRVYIFGSHDYAGGDKYCMGHYMGYSAPLSDLSDWTCHGVIYERTQDPTNKEDNFQLWAPDVCQGPDGRYYLYYCFSFVSEIGVAVSDSPQGPFEFYGHIRYPDHIRDGATLREYMPFDPAVFVDDDKRVYLYYGFSPKGQLITKEVLLAQGKPEEVADAILAEIAKMPKSPGAMVVELEADMVTTKGEPRMLIPGGDIGEGTPYEGHAFFEASSMRKVGDKYYFVYSSELSHELCYAISDRPDQDFVYGGILVSNGDIGYEGNLWPQNMIGNNHGGMVEINGEWYVFYHRQTHGTEFSRQGCAEKLTILEDGSIPQVEHTSYGVNGGPLVTPGTYPAAIASTLTCKGNYGKLVLGTPEETGIPYIYEEAQEDGTTTHYIANIIDTVLVGYKYFDFQ
ncbi:MAG: family 43 glycosylhydrolase, partial [Agathobacter sp.]|nr:family 43 glycosylhydrolase [Agathobacter sp.]